MIERIIEWSVHNRLFVLMVAIMAAFGGVWALRETPMDALPDLSDVQVIVMTEYPGQAPAVVDDQVTYPLSSSLLAVPYAKDVRGYSMFGISMVYVIFEDGTDLYWARSRVLEYLNVAQGRLPEGVMPMLGPDATSVGWVYEYTLTDFTPRARVLRARLDADGSGRVEDDELPPPDQLSGLVPVYTVEQLRAVFDPTGMPGLLHPERFAEESAKYVVDAFDRDGDDRISAAELGRAARFEGIDLSQLRSLQDWHLRYELTSLEGVSEVASVGGFVRQYQIEVDPEKLRAFGVTLGDVRMAVERANLDVGGRLIEMGETEFLVRGRGYVRGVDDLETIPVAVDEATGTPVLMSQIARVHVGPEVRRGLVEMNGQGEVVTGIVLLRHGGDAPSVIERVEERLRELQKSLPEGVEIHVSYDRSDLIDRAVKSLSDTLVQEMLIVLLICVAFLWHLRSAFVAMITVPLGALLAFIPMKLLGINADIMSLGGIAVAIGVMVDASVVMVENLHKYRERHPDAPQVDAVLHTAKEVGPALFFTLLIVTVSFLPVFALEQQEGRLFTPLAWTKTLALAIASVLAITLIPPLMVWLVRGKTRAENDNPLVRWSIALYRPLLRRALARPLLWLGAGVVVALITVWPWSRLGSEFMPPLDEGDLLYMPTTPPGLSITKARELVQQTDRIIASHPQVRHVLGKVGRAETATDPAPMTMLETIILLDPPEEWPRGKRVEDVIRELDAMVQFPGVTNSWTMPIKTRMDMLATGIKTPVGVKLLGDDLEVLSEVGAEIEAVLRGVPGTASVYSERATDGNYVEIDVRRADAARYGLNVADVHEIVGSAIGGSNVTWTVEGLERYPVNVRYPRELRDDLFALSQIAVPAGSGKTVPLAHIADIEITKGPPMIKSEDARRTSWIYVDLSTSDIGGYVERAKDAVDAQITLPPGVSILWSGQYEYMERANKRLAVVIPLTLGLIFVLLYAHFRRIPETVMVMVATLVFAPIGGVWFLWAADFNVSVAVVVGFIALMGVAAETGVVMFVYLDEAWDRWVREGRMRTLDDLRAAISEGAVDRVRPKLMTVLTDLIGMLPILVSVEAGVKVTKRIAAPMVGGMVSSTVLTLLLIPVMYYLWKAWTLRQGTPVEVEVDIDELTDPAVGR